MLSHARVNCCASVSLFEVMSSGMHVGYSFDVVYTSWLSRAIETAWLVLAEIDCLWTPIHKSWRLNERMYGALTGLSKKKTRAQYGDVQFKLWRRSYNTKPPPVRAPPLAGALTCISYTADGRPC
eukprot:5478704-Pleurochrysis_carterae.AAC.1